MELNSGTRFFSPLLQVFMKGVAQVQPPKQSVQDIWDPKTVLDMYRTEGSNEGLALLPLARKTAMLTALATGQRVQTLSLITINNIERKPDCLCCRFPSRLKQTKGDRPTPLVHLPRFPDPLVCVYSAVTAYMDRTEATRQAENLFVVSTKKRTAAAAGTISSWIKTEMARAGIDTNFYTAHSTRAAATSKAAGLVSMDRVMSAADWASEATFARYYNKQITSHGTFMQAVWDG